MNTHNDSLFLKIMAKWLSRDKNSIKVCVCATAVLFFIHSSPAQNAANDYGFTGEACDNAAGLIDLRARYFDPETGAFLTKDPLGATGTLNGYSYCNNNPINSIDPSFFDVCNG